MACKHCHKSISPQAKFCPFCGHPVEPSDGIFSIFLFCLFIVLPAGVIWWGSTIPSHRAEPTTREEHIRQVSDDTGVPMVEVREAVDRIEGR